MSKRHSTGIAAASFLLLTGAAATCAPAASASPAGTAEKEDRESDFDGDGYTDVLTGAPGGTVSGEKRAGYVTVQYGGAKDVGTATGTFTGRVAVFSQSTSGVPGTAEAGDAFGSSVASGDLNGDGYDDAIIGAPGEDVSSMLNVGRITVLYGSANGLRSTGSVSVGAAEQHANARFGSALSAARFFGATQGDVVAVADVEGADLLRHDAGRLKAAGRIDTMQEADGEPIKPSSLTTGDYDADGYSDLVISGRSQAEDGTGRSAVYAGGVGGLTYARDLGGGPATASGDINNDGYDDFVYGHPDSPGDLGEPLTGGVVGVYFGSDEGVRGVDDLGTVAQVWSQYAAGVPGTAELGDGFGSAVSLGDTDGDGYADLAIGAPGEDVGTIADAGAVWVLRGSSTGLTADHATSFSQNSTAVPGTAERGDGWGRRLRLADTNDDGRSELLAAAPGENTSDGAVWLLPAGSAGVTATGSWAYAGHSLGAQPADARFGAAMDQ
ncbi:esterase [Streptomyces sp. WSLK1-3]|uniref:esterase n=1 Tax=Streptomyces sp. WSLK1-3 TaxID=3375475 RepID=UPI00379092A2